MKKWIEMKSLSFKLTFFFTIISLGVVVFCSVSLTVILAGVYFNDTITPSSVKRIVESENIYIAKALQQNDASFWVKRTSDILAEKLETMPLEDAFPYTIKELSNPKVYIRVTNNEDVVVYTNPGSLPENIQHAFTHKPEPEGHIWVVTPMVNDKGEYIGTVTVLFVAIFDSCKVASHLLNEYLDSWYYNLLACAIIALSCSLVANRFVAGPLKRIDAVTEEWCRGNFAIRIKIKKKGGDILAEHSRKLNSMADELETLLCLKEQSAMAAERNRVARELHDTVKQNLFALKLQLATGKGKATLAEALFHIEEAEKIAGESQHEIMEILTHLSPEAQAKGNFYGRMAVLADDIRRRFNATLVWQQQDPVDVSPEQEHTLVRLAQEAINNAVRHGSASTITMSLVRENNVVRWTITDNGCGLPQKSEVFADGDASGSGLVFMRERTAGLPEGSFSIENAVGYGVVIRIQWRM